MKTKQIKIWEVVFRADDLSQRYAAETFDELMDILNAIRRGRDIHSITYVLTAIQCTASE